MLGYVPQLLELLYPLQLLLLPIHFLVIVLLETLLFGLGLDFGLERHLVQLLLLFHLLLGSLFEQPLLFTLLDLQTPVLDRSNVKSLTRSVYGRSERMLPLDRLILTPV